MLIAITGEGLLSRTVKTTFMHTLNAGHLYQSEGVKRTIYRNLYKNTGPGYADIRFPYPDTPIGRLLDYNFKVKMFAVG